MGRRSKLTPKLQEVIVHLIEQGNYDSTAAAAAGIAPSTFYRWLEQGEAASSGRYREFWEAVSCARAMAEVYAVSVVRTAADSGDWRAALEWLARKAPERWARNRTEAVPGEQTVKTVSVTIGSDPETPAERAGRLGRLRRASEEKEIEDYRAMTASVRADLEAKGCRIVSE
jgi:hypothetical protein